MNNDEKLELIFEAKNYCEKLYTGMNKLKENIDERNLDNLEVYFKNILEGFTWILEIVVSVVEKLDLNEIQQKINRYVEGYNNIDLLYVRDILEYELMPQVESFYGIIIDEIQK